MRLYSNPRSPSARRVEATIHHLGLDVELVPIDVRQGEHRRPEFLAVNPNGMIPTLEDGNHVVWESGAIMQYLAADDDVFYPSARKRRCAVNGWVQWNLAHFNRHVSTIVFERIFKSFFEQGEADEAIVENAMQSLDRFAAVLDARLESGPYLMGGDPTLADFHIVGGLAYAQPAKLDFTDRRRLREWIDRIEKLPAFQKLESLSL